MPNRKQAQAQAETTLDSRRWPNLYGDVELAAELVHSRGWTLLLQDLLESQGRVNTLKHITIYNVPRDEAAEKIQCFYRGKIAAYEDVINLAKDLKQWKERDKK